MRSCLNVRRDPGMVLKARRNLVVGLLAAAQKNYLEDNLVMYGELIGPSLNGNIHEMPSHFFYPFEVAEVKLRYKSFN